MNEEELKALLGENFDNAKDFFKNQVLGNGDYVTKGKAEADVKALQTKLNEANEKIKANMTDEETKVAEAKAKDDLIAQLQAELSGNKIEANQAKALGNITEATTLVGVKSDDKDLVKFIENIATEDSEKTIEISQYVSKVVKDAYEKGKSEATKQNLGKLGGFNANGGTNNSENDNKESTAERLAKEFSTKNIKSNYFKN